MNLIKEYELNIPERPFKIYWHGKFLRSYDRRDEFERGIQFFNSFLIAITTKEGEFKYEI